MIGFGIYWLSMYSSLNYCLCLSGVKEHPGYSIKAQRLKHLPGLLETRVQSLGREDPLEKAMAGNPLQYSCLENPMDGGAL